MSEVVRVLPYSIDLGSPIEKTPMNELFVMGDNMAHRFEVSVMKGGAPVDLTGCTVTAYFTSFAKNTSVKVDGTVSGSKASVTLSKPCYTLHGQFALVIQVISGEPETTIFCGDGFMRTSKAETIIYDDYVIYDVSTLLSNISAMKTATQEAKTATSNANTATSNANTATNNANTATGKANTAADAANAAAGKIDNMTVSATPVETGTATAALSTVDGHYHLALGLPNGDTGATPRISVQVQTGAAGSEAQVSVSGTAEEPVILLTIPRGDVGDIGALTINGKTPDVSGAVTLEIGDIDGLSDAIANAGGVKTVAGVGPDGAGNVALTAADVGALPSGGTAADSSKLGGKAPEYYIQPRNLLDNSDFTNPVNQRGNTEITGDWNYGIDRWLVSTTHEQNPNGSILIADDGLSMGYWTDMMQLIPFEQLKSKTLTFAVCTENGVYAYAMTLPETAPSAGSGGTFFGDGIWNDIIVMETIKYDNNDSVMFRFRNAQTTNQLVYWAALYEGSYTADTLPLYVPKGYAAELAECQRYYWRYKGNSNLSIGTEAYMESTTVARLTFEFAQDMRVTPTVNIEDISTLRILCVGGLRGVESYTVYRGTTKQIGVNFTIGSETTAYTPCVIRSNSGTVIEFSADL